MIERKHSAREDYLRMERTTTYDAPPLRLVLTQPSSLSLLLDMETTIFGAARGTLLEAGVVALGN